MSQGVFYRAAGLLRIFPTKQEEGKTLNILHVRAEGKGVHRALAEITHQLDKFACK